MPAGLGIEMNGKGKNVDPNMRLYTDFLRRILPADKAGEITAELTDAILNSLSSPRTTMHLVSEKLSSVFEDADLNAIRGEFLHGLPSFWLEWAKTQVEIDEEKMGYLANQGAARELMRILFEMYSEIGGDSLFFHTLQTGLAGVDVLKPAATLGKMFDSPDLGAATFEKRTRTTASTLSDLTECFYKPYLQVCLGLTRVHSGREPNVPQTLGAVIGECHGAWQSKWPELLPLLSSNARIIRNSESHANTEIDPALETIRFVNVRTNGEREFLGPLSENEYVILGCTIEREFLALQAALECTFRRIWMLHQVAF